MKTIINARINNDLKNRIDNLNKLQPKKLKITNIIRKAIEYEVGKLERQLKKENH